MRAVGLMLAVASGCGPHAHTYPHDSLERAAPFAMLRAPVVVGPVDARAEVYREPPSAADEVTADERLDAVAMDLARAVKAGAMTGATIEPPLVDFVLRERGVIEPSAGLAVADTEDAARAGVAGALKFSYARVGVAHAEGGPWVALAIHRSLFELAVTPRWLPAGGHVHLAGTLSPIFHAPRLTIVHDGARATAAFQPSLAGVLLSAFAPFASAGPFVAPFSCGARAGTAWLAIDALDGEDHSTRLALFPIECGRPPPVAYRVEPVQSQATGAEQLAAVVNRERVAAGGAPLRVDLRARAAATRYVARMAQTGSIEHELAGTTPPSRLRDAALIPLRTAEVTLHADDLRQASELLMNEPAYRAATIRRDMTHIGIALAPDPHGGLYVAIELVAILPPIDTDALRRNVWNAVKRAAKPDDVFSDARLTQLAQWAANQLAVGWSPDDLDEHIENRQTANHRVFLSLSDATRIEDFDAHAFLRSRATRTVGIGVAQSPPNGALAGRVWIVGLFVH